MEPDVAQGYANAAGEVVLLRPSRARRLAPLIPYLAVLCGLYWLRSAWAAILLYHLGMVVMLSAERQWASGRTLFSGYAPWHLPVTALGGIGVGAVLYLLWPMMGIGHAFGGQLARLGLTSTLWPFFIGYFLLVNPWLEELYWRGYLGFSSKAPTWNDLFFAGYHLLVLAFFVRWPWLLASLCSLIVVAWLWRQLARQHNGLFPSMMSHAFADAGTIAVIYLFAFGR